MRNFIFKQVFLLLLTFFYAFSGKAQTATGGCSTVTVTNDGAGYPTNTFFSFATTKCQTQPGCCTVEILSGNVVGPRFFLQMRLANGTWSQVQGPQNSAVFNVTTSGTFRVQIEVPRAKNFVSCAGGVVQCVNQLGQNIGTRSP